jgi:hypothetical protein
MVCARLAADGFEVLMVECRTGVMPRKVLIIERCRQTGPSVVHSVCIALRDTMDVGLVLMALDTVQN